jgi:transposase
MTYGMTQKNKMIYDITEDEWKLIENKLPGKAGDVGHPEEGNRAFLRAVFWIARTDAPWRALPPAYGKWSSVHKRFIRWSKTGVWKMIFDTLATSSKKENGQVMKEASLLKYMLLVMVQVSHFVSS